MQQKVEECDEVVGLWISCCCIVASMCEMKQNTEGSPMLFFSFIDMRWKYARTTLCCNIFTAIVGILFGIEENSNKLYASYRTCQNELVIHHIVLKCNRWLTQQDKNNSMVQLHSYTYVGYWRKQTKEVVSAASTLVTPRVRRTWELESCGTDLKKLSICRLL